MARKARCQEAAAVKPPGMKIKKGDHVVVIAGRDRGREGTVIRPTRTSSGCWSRAST